MELLKVCIFQQDGIHFLMEAGTLFLRRRDRAVGKVLLDKPFPLGALFIAPIQAEVHGKTHRTTNIMTRDRIMREGIGVVAMVVMAVHIVEKTTHMLTQGIIEDQECVSLRPADCLRLLEQIREPTVIDTVLKPGRFREEAREIGFVSTLDHTAGDVRQAFVVQDDQTCQVILEMLKLAPILKEVPEDICMSSHEGSGRYDRKRHQALPFHIGGGIGPESITARSEMAKHNSRGATQNNPSGVTPDGRSMPLRCAPDRLRSPAGASRSESSAQSSGAASMPG